MRSSYRKPIANGMTPFGHGERVIYVGEAILIHTLKTEKIKREVTINLDSHGCITCYWLDNFNHDESIFWPVKENLTPLIPGLGYKLKFPNQAQENRFLKAVKDARAPKVVKK